MKIKSSPPHEPAINRGDHMDLKYVKRIIKILAESDVDEIEIEEEGKRIRVAKHMRNGMIGTSSINSQPINVVSTSATLPQATAAGQSTSPPPAEAPREVKYHEIKSPIVGTFYRAPAPDAAPFVEVGSVIAPGTVLCIIEAMKLMNEIESDVSGKVVKVMVENGQPVEYDQTIFQVDTAQT
jgi:acetyl-CoA carboxylase biotin carboxyl carrier protein